MALQPELPTSPTTGQSTTTRPLGVRKRSDVVVVRQYGGGGHYVLKNPVDLQYFRLLNEEYFVWNSLDGTVSLDGLKQAFEGRFSPQCIRHADLQQLVMSFHERNLAYSLSGEQGEQLWRRRGETRRKERLARLANPLAVRLRGIDPNSALTAVHRYLSFLFRPTWLTFWSMFAVASLLLCLVRFEDVASRLPRFQEFFTPTNLIELAIVMAVVKVFHELGHGLACKHFGGEVRELGVMFLILTPCLYCNVSDSWMFPSKWRRAAVGAAGVYFELMLASIAAWIWWLSVPGTINDLALNVAFVCSVSTLVFNANPLMRFDGYYVFSDLVEIPNLSEKCNLTLQRLFGAWCLGIDYPPDYRLPDNRQSLFVTYGIAAFLYRWFVTISILYFLYTFFEQYRLVPIFFILAAMAVAPRPLRYLWKGWKVWSNPSLLPRMKTTRCIVTAIVAAAALVALFILPLPHRVTCPAEIAPAGDHTVYAEVPGVLVEVNATFGDVIHRGEMLARLDNVDLRIEATKLRTMRDETAATLAALEKNQFTDRNVAFEVAVTRKALDAAEQLLKEREDDVRRLNVTAPADGVLLPPADFKSETATDEELPGWTEQAMDRRNRGCKLEEGEVLCRIGDPHRLEAEVVVEHQFLELVAAGQRVEIMFDAVPGRVWRGTIVEVAEANLAHSPKRLSQKGGGEMQSKTDRRGVERPRHASYLARVTLDHDAFELLTPGVRGRAKVLVGQATIAQRCDRYLRNLFNFEM